MMAGDKKMSPEICKEFWITFSDTDLAKVELPSKWERLFELEAT